MIENVIEKLFKDSGLGKTDQPITPVPGGFMHRMQYLFQKEKEIKDVFEQLKDGRHKSERNEAGRLNNCLECPG